MHLPVLRIMDANANRAREALRVMEDGARFLLDDADLSGALKQARHDLAGLIAQVRDVMALRDTPGDVGTTLQTQAEYQRPDSAAVVAAAAGRLSEALRSLEEYAKALPATALKAGCESPVALAQGFEALRYRGYELEKQLVQRLGRLPRPQWRLCVLLTASLCRHHDLLSVARMSIEGGADCLQLREKSLPDGQLLDTALKLRELTSAAGVSLMINDRPDIALLCDADAVHLGQDDLPVPRARKLLVSQHIGVSTSTLAEAEIAWQQGADYCGVGPMFPTTTKHKEHLAGPAYLREFLTWNRLPHLAIGGITPENLPTLVEAGVQGIAVSSVVCAAKSPESVCQALRVQLAP